MVKVRKELYLEAEVVQFLESEGKRNASNVTTKAVEYYKNKDKQLEQQAVPVAEVREVKIKF